ncbi:MULE domain-containing protein [Trichonephila inaurata madagascariensis]|uniref:MULE domain-containing protein n=1 Tax=Trichonephila inaurata madagascariensis TaxID=2747483 RepID=A0A8X6MHR5_9ARAC|nr:MULE domain-containing protein [Trichonephila inaurata madagascariensis]
MTDDDKTTGPAFKKVFGEGVKHLLCKWHIHRAWKKQLNNLVSDFEIRHEIYASLVVLLEEKSSTKFKQTMENFRVAFVDKEPAFIKYFDDYYYNRTDLWRERERIITGTPTSVYSPTYYKRHDNSLRIPDGDIYVKSTNSCYNEITEDVECIPDSVPSVTLVESVALILLSKKHVMMKGKSMRLNFYLLN